MLTRSKCGPNTSFSAEGDDKLRPIATRQLLLMHASSSISHNHLMPASTAIDQNQPSASQHTHSNQ